jgi:exodeoxyribonuclease VII large subunit
MTLLADTPATPRVSQLATSIQRALRTVGSGWVEGEVQRRKTINGHTYFTLADENATIECCVWRSRARRIRQWPADGQLVQVHFEKVDFYARRGSIALHVDDIRLTGEGELLARKQVTLDKLTAEGLVARARRSLARFPRRVGVIAARDSDAKHDVIKALRERWPAVHIVHCPALVEGVRAVHSVIGALAHLQGIDGVDAIILARGGGGVRELVAFDDERLCRAVFACAVPVVTSIGHTAQRPNCDHLAAAYADVPARAAELVVPSAADLAGELDRHLVLLENVPELLRGRAGEVGPLWERARPRQAIKNRGLELERLDGRLERAMEGFYAAREKVLDDARHRLARVRAKLPAPTVLDLPAQRLRTAAERFFEDRDDELDVAARALAASRARVPVPDDVGQLAARLVPAAARARRRAGDYQKAFIRLREQVDKTFVRYLREHDREVTALSENLAQGARRRLAEAQRAVQHVVELIAARDFRRSGWVLAGDAAGQPVRSAADVAPGDELKLHFHDGRADAAITTIETDEGDTNV